MIWIWISTRMEVAGLQPKVATPNMARAELLRLNRRSIQERNFHYDNDAGACYSLYSLSSTRVNRPIYLWTSLRLPRECCKPNIHALRAWASVRSINMCTIGTGPQCGPLLFHKVLYPRSV